MKLGDGADKAHLTVVQHADAMADLVDIAQAMAGEEHRPSARGFGHQHFFQRHPGLRVEPGHRLVEDQQRTRRQQRADQPEFLADAFRVGADAGVEAHRIGLVHEVWPNNELERRANDLARQLADGPAIAVAGVLRSVVGAEDKTLEEALAEERRAVMQTMGTKDQREGMSAFLEKRKPKFTGE